MVTLPGRLHRRRGGLPTIHGCDPCMDRSQLGGGSSRRRHARLSATSVGGFSAGGPPSGSERGARAEPGRPLSLVAEGGDGGMSGDLELGLCVARRCALGLYYLGRFPRERSRHVGHECSRASRRIVASCWRAPPARLAGAASPSTSRMTLGKDRCVGRNYPTREGLGNDGPKPALPQASLHGHRGGAPTSGPPCAQVSSRARSSSCRPNAAPLASDAPPAVRVVAINDVTRALQKKAGQ